MFLIAEIGSNWDGNMNLARDNIRACRDAGANAVKFQLWKTEIVYPNNPENRKWEMSFDQFKELYNYAKSRGIMCFATPSYPEAVDFLESLHVPMYKIASVTSAMKHPYALETMKKVAETGKPIMISNGYGFDLDGINRIFEDGYILMDCVAEYPAKIKDYGLYISNIDGLSDHTKGTILMLDWLKQNPDLIIEKHVKLRDNSSPDSPFSLYNSELADFITLSRSL